jgi:hypothetical protein
MKLAHITTYYLSYLKQVYNQRYNLNNQPYKIQYETLIADCFGWSDFWVNPLSKFGYEVIEIIGNVKPMQVMWAKENKINFNAQHWLTDIIIAQVKPIFS